MNMKVSDLPAHTLAAMGLQKAAPASKYKVRGKDTRTADGITFDSKAEMHRYRALRQMVVQGLVRYFLRQVPFHLPGGVRYVCDFMVVYPDGRFEFEDVKGMKTAMYILKKKQVEALYPIRIREITNGRGNS